MQFTKMEYLIILEALSDLSKNAERNIKDRVMAEVIYNTIKSGVVKEFNWYHVDEEAEVV